MSVITAEYPGICIECDVWFEKGTKIKFNDQGARHAPSCPVQGEGKREICPRCFLELPVSGVCGVCEPGDE